MERNWRYNIGSYSVLIYSYLLLFSHAKGPSQIIRIKNYVEIYKDNKSQRALVVNGLFI